MGRDDMILGTEVLITALARLWVYDKVRDSDEGAYDRMRRVTDDVADRALLKVYSSNETFTMCIF